MTPEQAMTALQTGKLVTYKMEGGILKGTIRTSRTNSKTYLQFQEKNNETDPFLVWVGPEELELAQ